MTKKFSVAPLQLFISIHTDLRWSGTVQRFLPDIKWKKFNVREEMNIIASPKMKCCIVIADLTFLPQNWQETTNNNRSDPTQSHRIRIHKVFLISFAEVKEQGDSDDSIAWVNIAPSAVIFSNAFILLILRHFASTNLCMSREVVIRRYVNIVKFICSIIVHVRLIQSGSRHCTLNHIITISWSNKI